jgi:hypothetical protein
VIAATLINLDSAQTRRARMQIELAPLVSAGLVVDRVGVDLRGWPRAAVAAEVARRVPGFTLGHGFLSGAEVGCWLSHLAAWQALVASDAAAALVFEDDLRIDPQLADLLPWLSVPLALDRAGLDLLFLGTSSCVTGPRIALAGDTWRACVPGGAVYNTWAYAVSRAYAQQFLARPRLLAQPIDHVLGGRVRRGAPRIAVLDPMRVTEAPDLAAQSQIEPTTWRIDRWRVVEATRRRWLASPLAARASQWFADGFARKAPAAVPLAPTVAAQDSPKDRLLNEDR